MKISPRWALQLAVVSLCVLFFQGCENSRIQLTTGPWIPFAQIDYDDDAPLDSQLTYLSIPRLVFNLVGLGVFLLVVPWCSTRACRILARKEVHLAMILVAVVFNSILFFSWLWLNAVFWPTSYLADLLAWLVGDPTTPTGRQAMMALAARLYFLLCWAGISLLLAFGKWAIPRYVFIEPNRWWQFNLRSLLLATFILGTGLGLLLRVWR